MANDIPWTHFFDMHSGGGQKEEWEHIYIQAPEDEAVIIFQNLFGHNPWRVSCSCCGSDYILTESNDLAQLTAYYRECRFSRLTGEYIEEPNVYEYSPAVKVNYRTLGQYLNDPDAVFIPHEDIYPEDREGELRRQGYVWVE